MFENLSFRGNVIAWLKGCLLYVANDYKWDKTIEDFVRWSLQYDMWCKMQFFAEAIESADCVEQKTKRGPRNLLELLPDEFTLQDAVNVRRQQGMDAQGCKPMIKGMDAQGCKPMIRMWKVRCYIEQITDNSYKKVK